MNRENLPTLFSILFATTTGLALPAPVSAGEYELKLDAAISTCSNISGSRFESGLWLNPQGYQTYYERSRCFQETAVEYRVPDLCEEVRERESLVSTGWAYSRVNCRTLVNEKLIGDREEMQTMHDDYHADPVRLVELQVIRHGNGRDYVFMPRFAGGFARGYQLDFQLRGSNGEWHSILAHASYMSSQSNLRLYLRRQDLLVRFPDFERGREFRLRALLHLPILLNRVDGWIRQDMLDEIFPESERTQVFTTRVTFQ